jgi:hypothetical protein
LENLGKDLHDLKQESYNQGYHEGQMDERNRVNKLLKILQSDIGDASPIKKNKRQVK